MTYRLELLEPVIILSVSKRDKNKAYSLAQLRKSK